MMDVCGVHSNTCNPSYVGQYVLAHTCFSNSKKCADQCLKEVMVQMTIEPFVSIRAIRELLSKVVYDRKYIDKNIDKNMINNVRIRARKKRLELENAGIEIDSKHFDTSFITSYRDTSVHYTEGKFLIVTLFDLFS